ncbi:MAG: succinate-semialdehyde dehydrogenase / glutarate-semialdehyde dehydrogenase [Acidimicrobiaceae bacterium]|nr:succinate-semialdehyde dehydrogenase / glutarate-semialdehyde dehydrogenase [Acidimicrobiaceae bacterium]
MSSAPFGPPLATVNPTTGETLQRFEPFDADEVETRLAAAEAAAAVWAATPVGDRSRLLITVAELLEGELPDIAHVLTTEMGKPFAQAKGEVAKCASAFRWYAEHGPAFIADEEVPIDGARGLIRYQPLGAVLAIMPWNFPLWQVVRFAAPGILAGNVGLLKHAPNVPRTSLLLEDLFRRAGAPTGVFQSLLIGTDQVPAIIADPRVKAVTLTGSVGAGRAVGGQAGAVGKKVVLELGGSDPFIVLPSADLDRAIPVAVQARVQNNGQSCIAAKRFIVHEAVADAFTDGFVAGMDALSVGDPFDPATEVGPLVTVAARNTIEEQVEDARSKGATILCGGERVVGPGGSGHPGFFYRPTVITGITPEMRVATEEVFGPVALLFRVASADEALRMANGTEFGLGSSVWSTEPDEQLRFVNDLEAGLVFVNGMVASMPPLPFGGIKSSGHGRELSAHGIREFCNIKSISLA